MKSTEAENFYGALTDPGVQFKFLSVDEYMKSVKLVKKVTDFVKILGSNIETAIVDYNKDFNNIRKSKAYKDALKKKEKQESLTEEETTLVEMIAPVQFLPNGRLSGPDDFIDKIEEFRKAELELSKDELNFVKDHNIFKSVVENASVQNQLILYERLLKS